MYQWNHSNNMFATCNVTIQKDKIKAQSRKFVDTVYIIAWNWRFCGFVGTKELTNLSYCAQQNIQYNYIHWNKLRFYYVKTQCFIAHSLCSLALKYVTVFGVSPLFRYHHCYLLLEYVCRYKIRIPIWFLFYWNLYHLCYLLLEYVCRYNIRIPI